MMKKMFCIKRSFNYNIFGFKHLSLLTLNMFIHFVLVSWMHFARTFITYDRIFDKNSLSSIHTRITKNTLFIFLMACLMIAICCLRQRKRNVKDIADCNLSSRSHFNIAGSSQITYLNYQS